MKIGKLKVGQIRKELETRGLDSSGTRPALLKRLREALSREGNQPQPPVQPIQEPKELPTHYPEHPRVESPPPALPSEQPADIAQPGQEQPAHLQPEPQAEQRTDPAIEQRGEEMRESEQTREDVQEGGAQGGSAPELAVELLTTAATGSLARASETSMDERLRKRRERFGAVERAPVGTKRLQSDVSEEERRMEEAKARRAAKFGPASEPLTSSIGDVSQEERERRLKRQRRFASIGNATVV